jgi:peptide/nickel transport system permease protein
MVTKQVTQDFSEAPPRRSGTSRFVRVFFSRKLVIIGFVITLILVITAIFAPWLAPHDPYAQDLTARLLPTSADHLLGTDNLGRDTLSRVIYGSRTSLMVGIVSVLIASSIGITLGLAAGYFGGVINMIIMRFVDSLMSFPMILLALVVAALLGAGLVNIMIAIGVTMMASYARVMCAQVLTIRENEYITAERSIGAPDRRIMFIHVLPNSFPPLIVMITMQLGSAILAEASLSFLGIGVAAPMAAWGGMVNDGQKYLLNHPQLSFAPGVAIMLVVFAFNLIGDGLRDALDPRLKGTL